MAGCYARSSIWEFYNFIVFVVLFGAYMIGTLTHCFIKNFKICARLGFLFFSWLVIGFHYRFQAVRVTTTVDSMTQGQGSCTWGGLVLFLEPDHVRDDYESDFILACLNVLSKMGNVIVYFLSISSLEHRTSVKSQLLNIFLVSPLCQVLYSSICIVCWQLIFPRGPFSRRLYVSLSQTEPTHWIPC